ncbi:hypothetical protein [Pseudomonas alvandae]|uniref:hypothetical protein n=1 Tax=Pseudomonas canavaninivorans TaxID=2842348 RepID=UPI00215F4DC2|nr:hypothetical protein [Pseudomonas canavaninivorans]UVM73977.1 hypothetical protein LOY40_07415 [Pseudomonas canavaninivorans]
MDHKLIDQALNELLSIKATNRTVEHIQGFAQLVCSAAGITVDSPTPSLASLPELHAAVSLIATQLDAESLSPTSSVSTSIRLSNRIPAHVSVSIHNHHGFGSGSTSLVGYGSSAEEALRSLKNNIHDHCRTGAK